MSDVVPPSVASDASPRRAAAMEIVRIHTVLCAVASFVPVPLLDSFIVSAVQLQMAEQLAGHYGLNFDGTRTRARLAAVGTGVAHEVVTSAPMSQLISNWVSRVPVIGLPLRHVALPAVLATYTYTLGKSYVDHYEAGGGFDDFKPGGLLQSPVAQVLV